MNAGIIATRYATALLGFAMDHGVEDRVYAEMSVLSGSFSTNKQLVKVLGNPIVPQSSKVELLCAAGGSEVSAEYRRFMEMIVERQREEYLPSMCIVLRDLYHQQKRLLYVDITSATALNETVTQSISSRVAQITGSEVRLNTAVDKELIGGFVMRWDTYRMDASLAGQLRRIEKRFKL